MNASPAYTHKDLHRHLLLTGVSNPPSLTLRAGHPLNIMGVKTKTFLILFEVHQKNTSNLRLCTVKTVQNKPT